MLNGEQTRNFLSPAKCGNSRELGLPKLVARAPLSAYQNLAALSPRPNRAIKFEHAECNLRLEKRIQTRKMTLTMFHQQEVVQERR